MQTVVSDPLIGLVEAAKDLDLTPCELRRIVAAREISVIRRGPRGHVKIRLSALEAWKREHTIPARKPRDVDR